MSDNRVVERSEAPPIGILPEKLWISNRFSELADACNRYVEAGQPIPDNWKHEMLRHGRVLQGEPNVAEWMEFFSPSKQFTA
jgi:hypothetical protein